MRHHTKDKGDIGVACVIADLVKHDIDVALPLSEHLPFDLIAIDACGRMAKVSVKYRTMSTQGVVTVRSRSVWNDRHGTHYRPHAAGDYDAVAIYCPDTDECYYVPTSQVSVSGITLRISEARNSQIAGVRKARWFRAPDRIFATAPVAQWIEQPPSKRQAEGSIPSGGAES
jgi:PD-(D/E)XK endonuclease